ncbi:neutral zinc metallopeptidase [Sphingomonas sp. 10B4]|uniref:KPN_02809 family neutral zinc metallopeptidase n=1 Tax=Sphingomonas sp. 10B4 TaxID=3048575 RepID=UPI002AB53590|nr:neutral zinc metallopeptidase [Sphingomonas sp. 10B4]MDY7525030.1 neutral zinc metallopeptidase [Sphingomonas sp. 10B4]MEB0281531.1 neutral zinc metallopeptidase [Sphingomonas sp. 10B4]
MRLDDFDPNINVEDQRGQGGSGFGGFGGGGGGGGLLLGLLPMVFSRFGCGGVAILLAVLFFFGGGMGMLGGGGTSQRSAPTEQVGQPSSGKSATASCTTDAASKLACNAFSSADKTWASIFQREGKTFQQPKLVFFAGNGRSGCGAAQSAMGPFYCPRDQGVYLDTSFFDELANRFGAKGDFAQDYVVAHEFGHHIQNLLGTSDQVASIQQRGSALEGNQASVKLELQADCYAGVWAAQNKDRLDAGDVEEGMTAAQAIGDDTLQKQSQGRVVPDSFTHGTSAQRMAWLRKGMDSGDPAQCDTFSGAL